ncbi:Gfo/Idh/MocA family protein [Paraburkholderia lycopersici]|uniref:Predicted dehydrogenase n=1 Tax=Paraburkholderia lycopersici TaxID=416944 RepID=A0A1G6TIC1_9BURK|nr:Gfo/Idh/MocA family oxidoreductase [Paraburkholderia lycopersici]SDD28177.1 Predicted dehydrogenase [Paraburkholderia lycopersici]
MHVKTQRFALIGAGVAAQTHARELRRVANASLVAVWARSADAAAAFAAANAIPRHYSDLAALLADADIDVVIITTPNGTHREYAVAAARAGKHVIVEKPLEITTARSQAIIDACAKAQRRLFVIYQRRYSKAVLQTIDDLGSGKLGDIVLVNIVDNQFRPRRYYLDASWRGTHELEGGGCVMTQSTHMIDLAQFILGPITSVYARTKTAYHEIDTEDVAAAVFEFAGGTLGTFSSSTAAYPGQRHVLTISGTAGTVMLNGEHDQIIFRRSMHDEHHADVPENFSFADPTDPRDYPTFGQRVQLERIVAALNDDSTAAGQEDLLISARVIDAIYESAASGLPVKIAAE